MATAVSNAVGTQKQFRKQPQDVYQKKLKNPSFGSSIGQHRDLGAEQLAASLGVLGKAIWKEKVEHEKREMNQLSLDEALNMVAGKTPEELAKFNKMEALQHADTGFNLTDNKYAMALLEKAMGSQASFLAKQQYLQETEGIVPTSVEDAVSKFTERFQETLKQYEGNIQNKEAFNSGVYENFYKDTLVVADKAREMIDRDKREAGLRCSATAFQDFITYSGNLPPDVFKASFENLARETQLYCKTADEAANFWKKVLKENVNAITSFTQLDAIKEVNFFGQHKFGTELPLGDLYEKVTDKFIDNTAKQITESCLREDGNVDLTKAREALTQTLTNTPNEKALAYVPDYDEKAWTRVLQKASDIARINNDKWQANENQLIVDLSKATSHEESRALIENADLPKYEKVKYFDALDKSIKAEAKALEKAAENERSETEKYWWDYGKTQYEKDNQRWDYLYNKQNRGEELSEKELEEIDRIAWRRDGYWSFNNSNYESQFGFVKGVHRSRSLPTDAPTDRAEFRRMEDIAYTAMNMQEVVQELQASGMPNEELKKEIADYCAKNGFDYDYVITQLNL